MCLAGNNQSQGASNSSEPASNRPTPPPEPSYYEPDFNEMTDYVDKDSFRMLLNEWREQLLGGKSNQQIKAWWENVKRLHGPRIVGHEECVNAFPLFMADNFSAGYDGTIQGDLCENCFK